MNVVERLYDGVCAVYENQTTTDPTTNVTSSEWVLVHNNIPCRLVVENAPAATADAKGASEASQQIVVLLSNTLTIKPGSRMAITYGGWSGTYYASGVPAIYTTHQEVSLRLERWA